jgi:hypothetical protein
MRKLQIILVVACLGVGAFFAARYVWQGYERSRAEEQCQGVARSLAARLMKEAVQDVSESRLDDLLREPGVVGPEGLVERNADGLPVDVWGNPFRARIVHDQGARWVEVTSAGPDATMNTDDDRSGRQKL